MYSARCSGTNKYSELTSEYAIRGTYCDLAVQFDGKVQLLIEVKAIGSPLQERHVKQAIDYACNKGVEWTVLTNGIEWVLYHVIFKKPIDKEEVVKLDLLEMDTRREERLEKLYLLTRTGLSKDAHAEFHSRQEATNRFLLAAILLSEDVLKTVRREVRRVTDLLVDQEDVARVSRTGPPGPPLARQTWSTLRWPEKPSVVAGRVACGCREGSAEGAWKSVGPGSADLVHLDVDGTPASESETGACEGSAPSSWAAQEALREGFLKDWPSSTTTSA